ncbi:hypothetical protein [Vallitalea okinawensis]|uniref:hypothetical protein n=1 Tax=Vallitalea okinawensis TaxID=2078660 RepID=UPI000CFAB9B4|nr:hypothetical protein [Vallitalea okinawensis]
MSFDLNILVIGQDKPSEFVSGIEIINERDETLRYVTWSFMSSVQGVMYTLGTTEDGLYNAMAIIDTDFQSPKEYPYWIQDQDEISNLTPIIVKPKYEEDVIDLLKQMIDKSPIEMIMFMTRYQGGDKEIVCGTIPFDQFILDLKSDRILFNTCYIIKKEKNASIQ